MTIPFDRNISAQQATRIENKHIPRMRTSGSFPRKEDIMVQVHRFDAVTAPEKQELSTACDEEAMETMQIALYCEPMEMFDLSCDLSLFMS